MHAGNLYSAVLTYSAVFLIFTSAWVTENLARKSKCFKCMSGEHSTFHIISFSSQIKMVHVITLTATEWHPQTCDFRVHQLDKTSGKCPKMRDFKVVSC